MSTISSFQSIENKRDIYKGKNYMKKFCESLREHTLKKKNIAKLEISAIIQANIEVLLIAYVI